MSTQAPYLDAPLIRRNSDGTIAQGMRTATGDIVPGSFGFSASGGLSDQSHGSLATPSSGGASKANTLWQETMWIPCGVEAVSIRLPQNVVDTSTYTNILAYVQTSDASGSGSNFANPYMAGVAQTMQSVTWAGGSASPTFTNAPDTNTPVGPWSDWIPVNNTGLNTISYLIIRQWWPAGVAAGGGYMTTNVLGGRYVKLAALGAGGLTGTAASNVGASNSATIAPSGAGLLAQVRFATQKRVRVVTAYGDSTTQGFYASGTVSTYERYALSSSLAGTPVAFTNRGASGQTSAQYYNRLVQDVAAGEKFDVIIYRIASVNDTASAAMSQSQISQAHGVLRIAKAMGALVIFEGPMPFTAGTPSANQLLCATNAKNWALNVVSNRPAIGYISYDDLHDATSYGKWNPTYNYTGDGLHPNELGITTVCLPAVTTALTTALESIS